MYVLSYGLCQPYQSKAIVIALNTVNVRFLKPLLLICSEVLPLSSNSRPGTA
jgi:hypothetical protein